jgi:hypothetical protein
MGGIGTAFGKYVRSPYERHTIVCSRPPLQIGQIGRAMKLPMGKHKYNTIQFLLN